MATFASKFNKVGFGFDTSNFEYIKLADIFNSNDKGGNDVVHPINGIFVHASKNGLGDSPVIIDAEAKKLVNLPSHMAETAREILADSEAVEAIKNGKVGYTIYEYESHGKKCYNVSFVDL